MKCNIVKGTIGKNSKEFYLCTTHKQFLNEEPDCTCRYKETEDFDRGMSWNASDIHSLEFVFSLPYIPENSKILVNKEETSVLFIEESKIIKDDFMGLYTSLKNHIELERVRCPRCNHLHSDDGLFATKPHAEHLCYYCGFLFKVDHPNIGNELYSLLAIAPISNGVDEEEGVFYRYDLLRGTVEKIS